MSDQADTLRRLMQRRNAANQAAGTPRSQGGWGPTRPTVRQPQVYTVASGKGGVGKSCLVANLGSLLAREGHRVLLVDGDFGLANLDILLGVQPTVSIEQVMQGEALVQDAVVGVEPNLWLLPAAAGLSDCRQADPVSRGRFAAVLESFPWEMDFVFVDGGSGIQDNVLSLHSPLFNSIVVLTPEPTSFTDAYGLIKILRRTSGINHVNIVVNQVTDGREAQRCFQKLKDVASRFVDVELSYLGHWQRDEKIVQSVMKRKILLDLEGGASSIPSLELLAKRIGEKAPAAQAASDRSAHAGLAIAPSATAFGEGFGNTGMFWRALLDVNRGATLGRDF